MLEDDPLTAPRRLNLGFNLSRRNTAVITAFNAAIGNDTLSRVSEQPYFYNRMISGHASKLENEDKVENDMLTKMSDDADE